MRADRPRESNMAKIWCYSTIRRRTLARLPTRSESAALAWQYVRVFDGHPVPRTSRAPAGLIVMGGPETVYQLDRYPVSARRDRLIESALKADRPVLGVCLGSQLLAAALGANVRRAAHKEIGWYPVRLRPEAKDDRLLRRVARGIRPVPLAQRHLRSTDGRGPARIVGIDRATGVSLRRERVGTCCFMPR